MLYSLRCRQTYTTMLFLCALMVSPPLMSESADSAASAAKATPATPVYPEVFSQQSDKTASDGVNNHDQTIGGGLVNADPVTAVAGLLLVVFLIITIGWLIRRLGGVPMMGGQALKVNAVLSVGAREKVVLVDVGEKQILLGVAPGRVSHLQSFDQPVVKKANADTNTDDFSSTIKSLLGKAKQGEGV